MDDPRDDPAAPEPRAGHAASAGYSDHSGRAQHSAQAEHPDHAGRAQHAGHAGHAAHAGHAGPVDHAPHAGHAAPMGSAASGGPGGPGDKTPRPPHDHAPHDHPGRDRPAQAAAPRPADHDEYVATLSRRGFCTRLDPRSKLFAALGFSLVTALLQTRPAAAAALLAALALTLLSGVSLGYALRRALAVNAFIAALWIFLPLRIEYADTFASLRLAYNPEGLRLAVLVTLKANAAFLALIALLGTSRAEDVFHAMAHMRVPPKLVTVFFLFHRYVHVIAAERESLTRAMRIRCFVPRTDRHTYRSYAYLVGMLLARSLDRAERVYQAMLCRGYQGQFWILDHFHWGAPDTAFCWATGLVLAALVLIEGSVA